MPKLGLGPAGLKTSRKRTGLELPPISSCKPGGEADVGNEAACHTSHVLDGGVKHTGA